MNKCPRCAEPMTVAERDDIRSHNCPSCNGTWISGRSLHKLFAREEDAPHIEEALDTILHDIVFMETVGMRPLIVHGGGAAISHAMDEAGITQNFVQGRRYTDEKSLAIVEEVLVNKINQNIVDRINQFGGHAEALSFRSHNVLKGTRPSLKHLQDLFPTAHKLRLPVDVAKVGNHFCWCL